jgi:hypothetical protein
VSSDIQWSGPASETGNVLASASLGALIAQGFSIDYERVPQAVADLEDAMLRSGTSAKPTPGLPL